MKRIDLTGKTFGKWLVLSRSTDKYNYWLCKCECGTIKEVFIGHLVFGKSKSCNCSSFQSGHPLYRTFRSIKERCFLKTSANYKYYGGRGITICEEWLGRPYKFVKWGINNGWSLGLTIERKDNNADYSPENCTFIPQSEQALNRRNTVKILYKGELHPLTSLVKGHGTHQGALCSRIKRGWTLEKALSTPVGKYERKGE